MTTKKKSGLTEEPPAKAPIVRMLMRFRATEAGTEPSDRDARQREGEASARRPATAPRPPDTSVDT